MKRLLRLIVFVLLLAGWTAFVSSVHIVRTADRNFVLIPKSRLHVLNETYVDARAWTLAEVPQHAGLVRRMIDAGKGDRLSHVGTVDQLEAMIGAAGTQPTQSSEAGDHVTQELSDALQRPDVAPHEEPKQKTTTRPIRHKIR